MGQPHCEGAGVNHVVEDLSGLLRPLAFDFDPVGLAADCVGEVSQGCPSAAARVEQTNGLSWRRASGPDEGGDPLNDGRRGRIVPRLRESLEAHL